MLILTATTIMKVAIDVDNVLAFDPQYDCSLVIQAFLLTSPSCRDGQTKLIKSIMMQAILYGSLLEVRIRYSMYDPASSKPCCHKNPLHFSFPPELDEESLMQGAEQLSQAAPESGRLGPLCLSFILCDNNRQLA